MSSQYLDDSKKYARIEGCEEDALVSELCDSAEAYLQNAGVASQLQISPLYSLAVKSLVLHWYDNRNDTGTDKGVPAATRLIINQMKNESLVLELVQGVS